MSEKDPTLLTCGMCGEKSLRIHNFVDCIAALKRDIAAAEERGRRAGFKQGVEEAALIVEPLPTEAWHHEIRYDRECLVRSIRALAPRDSGTSCVADEDGIHREARRDRK